MSVPKFSWAEIAKHDTDTDCWIVLYGKVYDVTEFAQDHPGGAHVILECAGGDATEQFETVHPEEMVARLPRTAFLGTVDPDSEPLPARADLQTELRRVEASVEEDLGSSPPSLGEMLNVFDFRAVARDRMTEAGWNYYSSGADDEITLRENHTVFQRVWLRPRVMVDVREVDFGTEFLGQKNSFPLYISATALAKLADPEQGEVALVKAAAAEGVPYMLPTLSSCSLDAMLAAKSPGQTLWFQLYVSQDREKTRALVERAEKGGCSALFITVDAPQLGRRERDMRSRKATTANVQAGSASDTSKGTSRALSSFIDPSLNWKDLPWFRSITALPLFLKGIQTGEDAVVAWRHGCRGIVVSNHGGRQLDSARSALEILPEVMAALRSAGVEPGKDFLVLLDGGIRRGTDIFKALALGATSVGIGRPALYGLAAFGVSGVRRVLQLLREEFETCLRMMGCSSVREIRPDHVLVRNLSDHFVPAPTDHLSEQGYEPLRAISSGRRDRLQSLL